MPDNQSRNDVRIDGGQVVAGNIGGSGNTGTFSGRVDMSASDQPDAMAAALEQLRSELAQLRERLAVMEESDAEPEEVDDVLEPLNSSEPDIARAASRWTRLLRRIPDSLSNLDTVARIVTLMEQVRNLSA
ncbi:hypothetical protein [Nocardia huaxiensis]|uniref:hypothetical protein n=1 Tax=Nocardia huaxiensis TaxID=2755382 RepID=UPI001E323280|nr:hypothetical protein [Nocardia huaxiensis]UFS99791.1 hypothetical protein LPY97_18885 [Nocardia huaxiensis]